MSQPCPSVSHHLPLLRDLLLSLPIQYRAKVHQFWKEIRYTLKAKQDEIYSLRAALQLREGPSYSLSPTRPQTSLSILEFRQATYYTLSTSNATSIELSDPGLVTLITLPPDWVLSRLENAHSFTSKTDCWFATDVPAHRSYTRDNMRRTRHPNNKTLLRIQPYRHRMAIVAKGQGQLLYKANQGGAFEVCTSSPYM